MSFASTTLPALKAADLLTRGYFHDRIVPPMSSSSLLTCMSELIDLAEKDMQKYKAANYKGIQRSRCVLHSVPKRKLSRRVLAIPNPRAQALICLEVEHNWPALQQLCELSPVSLSVPVPSASRALQSKYDRKEEGTERALRSIGARYVLKADFARFYPSIYTHSIPWAIHGKGPARQDRSNRLLKKCALS